jgi:hypothetical protein
MTAMARELGLSVSRVSRLIAQAERGQAKGKACPNAVANRSDDSALS